ncbi:Acyl carrier protein [Vibrio crassostreae]|nr:Acyl carrier protein [Vibrio crassostreae]CAK3798015.1 Acyl carrier protein [Vibrio crassostreae]
MSEYFELYEWLLKKTGLDKIDEDIDLIESKTIDSVIFIELTYNVEVLSGRSIDFTESNLDSLKTLSNIRRDFFSK